MIREEITEGPSARRAVTGAARMLLALKLDGPLLVGLGLIAAYGLVVLYSASGQSVGMVIRQIGHLGMGTVAMLVLAQVNPNFLRRLSPWLYVIGVFLLLHRRRHGGDRQGCAALAGPGSAALPAVGNHEAGGADDVRLVPARATAAAQSHESGGARRHDPGARRAWWWCSRISVPVR